jgi:hypothetical protein
MPCPCSPERSSRPLPRRRPPHGTANERRRNNRRTYLYLYTYVDINYIIYLYIVIYIYIYRLRVQCSTLEYAGELSAHSAHMHTF